MSDRAELEALRRMAELEDKAAGRLKPLGTLDPGISPEAGAMAAEDVGPGEATLIGLGRWADQQIRGTKQAFGMGGPDLAENQAYSALQKAHPFTTTLGENLPYVGLKGGPLSIGLQVAALEGNKAGSPQQRSMNALYGGLTTGLSAAAAQTIGKYLNPALSETQRGALSDMQDFGIKPRLSQVTQSPTIERFEDWASRTPGGAGVMETFNRGNKDAANAAAANVIGQRANSLSPRVLGDAEAEMGAVFNQIKSLPPIIRLGPGVEGIADDILKEQAKLGTMANSELVSIAKQAKLAASQKAKIPGDTLQLWLSKLSDKASGAFSGSDATSGRGYNALKNALFDSGESSLKSAGLDDLAQSFKTVRSQWGDFKTLTRGTVAKDGDLNMGALASVLRSENPTGFRTGALSGDLAKLGKIAEAFPPLRAGSPTYERMAVSDLPSTLLRAAPAYGVAKATTSPIVNWLPSTVGGTPIGKLLEMIGVPGVRALLASGGQIPLRPLKPQD